MDWEGEPATSVRFGFHLSAIVWKDCILYFVQMGQFGLALTTISRSNVISVPRYLPSMIYARCFFCILRVVRRDVFWIPCS